MLKQYYWIFFSFLKAISICWKVGAMVVGMGLTPRSGGKWVLVTLLQRRFWRLHEKKISLKAEKIVCKECNGT